MIFQIVQPFYTDIYGDSFKEAVKNYVKFNYNKEITELIIKDQQTHYKTRLKYYNENNKNKVGIDVYPYTNILPTIIDPSINSYINNPYVDPSINPSINSFVNPSINPYISNINNPMVTVKNSSYVANDKNIYLKHFN